MSEKSLTLPGLVDLQINGFGGVDFNDLALTADGVREAARLLAAEGVTAFLPTIITNAVETTERLLRTISNVESTDGAAIVGVHLEGPFISPTDGARGAHPKEHVVPPDFELFQRFQEAAGGRIRLLTLSPEWDGSSAFIERCRATNVLVAIGHTQADDVQIREAVAAGATLSTHLGNGLPPTIPRHGNPIWSQLAEEKLWASVIADGFHLPESVFRVIQKVKGEKLILVSDSTKFAGMSPGRYRTPIGGEVVLTPEGRLHLAADERLLAGSAFSLRQMVETLWSRGWTTLEEAWRLASENPCRFLRLENPGTVNVRASEHRLMIE